MDVKDSYGSRYREIMKEVHSKNSKPQAMAWRPLNRKKEPFLPRFQRLLLAAIMIGVAVETAWQIGLWVTRHG